MGLPSSLIVRFNVTSASAAMCIRVSGFREVSPQPIILLAEASDLGGQSNLRLSSGDLRLSSGEHIVQLR